MSEECKMRILSHNYAFESNVAISATSEDSNFPSENIGKVFRSQVWRSSGYFVINSNNNKINFVEVMAGPELTATLTAGNYTPTTLAAEIKAQMEAVSVDTFTVSYSLITGKWTIATSGSFLSILFGTGTNVASSVGPSLGYAVADKTGATSYVGAAIAIHTEEAVLIDLKTSENIDTFGIFFDTRTGIQLSTGSVIKLQASATNVWTAPPVDITLSIDDREKVITHYFTTDQHYRYWRVKIIDPKNANLYVELGTIFLGKGKTLTRNIEKGFKFNRRDTSRVRENDFGNIYVDELPIIKAIEFDYKNHNTDDLNILEDIYNKVGIKKPVMIAVDPTAVIFDKDKFSIMGRFTRQLGSDHVFKQYFTSSFRVEEVM